MLVRTFDTGLGLEGVHVLVTGGNGQIGSVVVEAFLAAGSYVTIIDSSEHCPHAEQANLFVLRGDITQDLTTLLTYAEERFGVVQVCIALAGLDLSFLPETDSICDADPLTWKRVFDVNIHGTFNTCQAWLRRIREASNQPDAAIKLRNVSLIIVGSEAGRDGVRTMAAYAAGKSAVQYGLLASLAKDVPRIWNNGRVNAIAPGAVDTPMFREEVRRLGKDYLYSSCEATAPLPGPVSIECVARTILFLSSSRYSGNVHGQLVHIDNGKSGPLAYAQGECPAYSLS